MASSKSLNRKRHSDQWWENHAPPGVIRCTGHMKDAERSQCRREAVPGLNVCVDHGGKVPSAIAAAFTRLGDSVEDAADVVTAIMNDPSQPARERLVAAQHVMKLLGMEKERVDVKVEIDAVEELFRAIAADPNATYDPKAVQVQALGAGEALPEGDEGPTWEELLGAREDAEDVVDAELVDEPARDRRSPGDIHAEWATPGYQDDEHTVWGGESGKTPKRISKSMERELRSLL